MIEHFFRPVSVGQAIELKRCYGDSAVWFAGGSKINATPTRTGKRIAISLENLSLNWADWDNGCLRISAMTTLQTLRDTHYVPSVLKEALGFVYSRHLRNQATLGGEIAALQTESVLLPVLLVLEAEVVFADGDSLPLEEYLADPQERLITEVLLHDPFRPCATRIIRRSQAGLSIVTAAVALNYDYRPLIALDGVSERPFRLRDIESLHLEGKALEDAVSAAIQPQDDIRGSALYKRYIAGVVVADLYAECQQLGETSE